MLMLLLIIMVLILCYVLYNGRNGNVEFVCEYVVVIGIIIFILSIVLFSNISDLIEYRVIDEKIKLYEKQNKEIEEKIEIVVKSYMEHESETLKGLKSDSYITLVTLYPNLKADSMVKQQIKLYEDNNKKITSLREEKLDVSVTRWWVYFGK